MYTRVLLGDEKPIENEKDGKLSLISQANPDKPAPSRPVGKLRPLTLIYIPYTDSSNFEKYKKLPSGVSKKEYSETMAGHGDEYFPSHYIDIFIPLNLEPHRFENALNDAIKMCGGRKKEKYQESFLIWI